MIGMDEISLNKMFSSWLNITGYFLFCWFFIDIPVSVFLSLSELSPAATVGNIFVNMNQYFWYNLGDKSRSISYFIIF